MINNSFGSFVFLCFFVAIGMMMPIGVFAQDHVGSDAVVSIEGAVVDDVTDSGSVLHENQGVVKNGAEDSISYELKMLSEIEKKLREKLLNEKFVPPSFPSLLFSPGQYSLLKDARIGFNARKPTAGELASGEADVAAALGASVREIALGGIAFISNDKWTIWLNKQRVTPESLPSEAMDLRVHKGYVELKWFDRQTNSVYPIRLRPNQRFNLDARMFVPGGS